MKLDHLSGTIRPIVLLPTVSARQMHIRRLQWLAAACAIVLSGVGIQQVIQTGDPNPGWLDIDPDF